MNETKNNLKEILHKLRDGNFRGINGRYLFKLNLFIRVFIVRHFLHFICFYFCINFIREIHSEWK